MGLLDPAMRRPVISKHLELQLRKFGVIVTVVCIITQCLGRVDVDSWHAGHASLDKAILRMTMRQMEVSHKCIGILYVGFETNNKVDLQDTGYLAEHVLLSMAEV